MVPYWSECLQNLVNHRRQPFCVKATHTMGLDSTLCFLTHTMAEINSLSDLFAIVGLPVHPLHKPLHPSVSRVSTQLPTLPEGEPKTHGIKENNLDFVALTICSVIAPVRAFQLPSTHLCAFLCVHQCCLHLHCRGYVASSADSMGPVANHHAFYFCLDFWGILQTAVIVGT